MKIFEYMMRNAAQVLFWTSILLFFGGLAMFLLLDRAVSSYDSDPIIDPRSLVTAIVQGLSAAVWPFMGAGLIWTLQCKRDGGTE